MKLIVFEEPHDSLLFAAELGDYQPDLHTVEMVSEFRFVPSQNETMEQHVYHSFQLMK